MKFEKIQNIDETVFGSLMKNGEEMVVTAEVSVMGHHAMLFAKSNNLEFVPIENAGSYKDVFQLGIFSLRALENIRNRTEGRVILHWCGSDAFAYQSRVCSGQWPKGFPSFVEHVAQSKRQIEALKVVGIEAKLMLRFTDCRQNYPLAPLPERYSVLVYTPRNGRDRVFNYSSLAVIIESCPDIHFTLFGQLEDSKWKKLVPRTGNYTRIGWISLLENPEEYRAVLKNTSVQIRFTDTSRGEGFSQMVMQSLLLGRRVLSNVEQEYVEKYSLNDLDSIAKRLRELKEVREPDSKASEYYHMRTDINSFDFIK